jgi:hypothetical protein
MTSPLRPTPETGNQVPLLELLRSVVLTAVVTEQKPTHNPLIFSSRNVPYGRYMNEAADRIADLERRLAKAEEALECAEEGIRVAHETRLEAESRAARLEQQLAEREADARRLDWLDAHGESYGFEGEHHGNRWLLDGPFRSARAAIDSAMEAT